MKKKTTYNYQKKKKGHSKALTITLLISAIVMTGLVAWLGVNDWSVEKSMNEFKEVLGLKASVVEEPPGEVTIGGDGSEEPVKEPVEPTLKPVEPTENDDKKPEDTVKPSPSIDNGGYIEGQKLPSEPTYIQGILIASKKYPLPPTFAPGEDKAARAAFEKMAAEAILSDFRLHAFSTYRAYDYQVTLYERYVARDGKEAADTYSARPGYSEHQTGLAFDIGEVNFDKHWASSSFGETEAGKWIAANAHRYGFIMRYPEGKEPVTGYMHESWHFRYVGIDIATEIYKQKITLEEYLGI